MRRLLIYILAITTICGLIAIPVHRLTAQAGGDYVPEKLSLFPDSEQSFASFGDYVSAPMRPNTSFSHIMIRYEASVPAGASLQLFVRASNDDGNSWSDWGEVLPSDDLWQESDGPDVVWGQLVEVGGLAQQWQVRATFTPAEGGAMPVLRQVDVSTVDTLNGPQNPAADQVESAQPLAATTAVARPSVVSRTAWGSPDGQGSRNPADYRGVDHLVVHHTADSNSLYASEANWAARVRGIWSYHAITRGWGDIGYNYLIDPNGVVYEGRAGGDNAVGFHDTGNYGSMGVAMLGTYQSVTPRQATQDSLVQLLAWKAAQRGIDPRGQSYYYGCSLSKYCYPYNAGSVVANIAGHRQVTPGHTSCPGDATMAIMPNIRDRVARLMGEGSEQPQTNLALVKVQYARTTLAAHELLQVALTIRNTGQTTVDGQAPRVDLAASVATNAYVYRADECFNGDPAGQKPAFPKEGYRVRATLGFSGWDNANPGRCDGATSDYPWRWGLNTALAPGEEQTIFGYVQFQTPGQYTLQGGLVQEYVNYYAQGVSPTTITVTAEKHVPDVSVYDGQLQPQAHAYRLASSPDSLLSRTDALQGIVTGEYLGSFAWQGGRYSWGDQGPAGVNDDFVIMQTRNFYVATSGEYRFRSVSDDGSWIVVDGVTVVQNGGLHEPREATGTIQLSAGFHSLGFVYFDHSGVGEMSYDVLAPGATSYQLISDGFLSTRHVGNIFTDYPTPVIAADDAGGSGISVIRWRMNGGEWQDQSGGLLRLGRLQAGVYWIQYLPIDNAGNSGATHELSFTVDPNYQVATTYELRLPVVMR